MRRGWTLDGPLRFKGEIDWKRKYGLQKVFFDLHSVVGSEDSDELPRTHFDVYGLDLKGASCAIFIADRQQVLQQSKKRSGLLAMGLVDHGPKRFQKSLR